MTRNETPTITGDAWLDAELLRCAGDPVRFNRVVLGRGPYWSKQREICRSLQRYRTTVVVTGNGVGKSFVGSGNALWFPTTHYDSKTVVAAPTQAQLSGVIWSEMAAAYSNAAEHGYPLGGRFKSLTFELGENWRVEGFGTGSVESKSGRHAADLLAVVDEASGTDPNVLEAIDSLNPSRKLYLGNPIRPEGEFYELAELSGDNPTVNVIRISSLESPHAHLERSPYGMADKGFLDDARAKYGEDSMWWLVHILAQFPGSVHEGLLPIPWLNLAGQTLHVPKGKRRMGVDIGEGHGGDESVIIVRDDNGVPRDADGVAFESSNRWDMDTLAERVRAMGERFDVEPCNIVYDAIGIGADFGNRLVTVGLSGCRSYKGSRGSDDEKFYNLRAVCGWALRRRLDPTRTVRTLNGKRPVYVPQAPFSLPPELLSKYRAEFQGIRSILTPTGEIALEAKEELVKRIKASPNVLDALIMTFAYPY